MDNTKKPTKSNPRKTANFLSQFFFVWAVPYLYNGAKNGLTTDDLTECLQKDTSEDLGDKLEEQWYKEVDKAKRKGRDPLLRHVLLRTFWRQCALDGFMAFVYVIIRSLLPLIFAQLLLQFQQPLHTPMEAITTENSTNLMNNQEIYERARREIFDSQLNVSNENSIFNFGDKISKEGLVDPHTHIIIEDALANDTSNTHAVPFNNDTNSTKSGVEEFFHNIWNCKYWLASIVVILTFFCCAFFHHIDLRQRMMGAQMRIACCSLIYRKTMRLSRKAAGQTPAGYLVNLLSNDVARLDYGFIFMHFIWILPIQAVLICYLIWCRIGIAALIGVVSLLLKTVPVQTGLSKLSSKLRMKIAERTDKRVGIMNEIVQGIHVIKMYAWEIPFQKVVAEARRMEVKQIRYASYLRGFYLSTMVFTERSTLFVTIAATVILGIPVTADVVFSMAQYYNILQMVAAIWYPLAVSFGAEALVSLKRIERFLFMEDHDEMARGLTRKEKPSPEPVELKNVSARWDDTTSNVLENINLAVKQGQLCAIIGPVGCGKSSLLQLILGELPIGAGTTTVCGDISYGSQEPWLFTGSVRNNILFGENYDKKRYDEVTRCCALTMDFQQLHNGDKTVVGDRGASLSGGQRARISLARAVYKPASIYMLDDPLSAVDAHVGRHLFDEVIGPKGRLAKEKATRLLVTHQVHFLKEADWIVIIEGGKISRQGTYNDLINSNLDFAKLLSHSEKEVKHVEEDKKSVTYEEDDIPYIDGEANQYLPLRKRSESSTGSLTKAISTKDLDVDEVAEDQATGGVSLRVWQKYFRAGASVCSLITLFFVLMLSQLVASGSDYFVNIWTQQEYLRLNNQTTILETDECLGIYGALIIGVILMTVLRGYLFFIICMRASKNLHNRMFSSILHATMRFFDTNPSGRILNRFSKDMGAIDELLPRAMMDAIQVFLVMFGILVVVSIVNPILLIALAIAAFLFYLLLQIYLRPAQDLKRLEGITKSPVFSHLAATLNGIATIRSRNVEDVLIKEFDTLQDTHSAIWQLTMSANTAMGLWMDMISSAFVTAVTFSFIVIHERTFSGNVGLAISQAMILTGMIQYGVRMATESLQQMTSVERVLYYTDLEQEKNKAQKPPVNWPQHGKIEFENMSLKYDINSPAVLKNLQITIEPTWKVGIVGRTGAGKSSFIGALFRLANIEGKIIIDGIDTSAVNLESLRSKISIIPQDPVLFSATIRYNLDPFEKYTDADLWKALEEVELKNAIPGLNFMVTEKGSNFSVGQRQLLCLARAILRNNKILVLDEATANVDPQTDVLIQKTIRTKFKSCTVLTVAHRLHTVMDSDRILVMDAGYAKEFNIPYILLEEPNSYLRDMVEATGPNESESLKKIAYETYNNLNNQMVKKDE